MDGPTFKGFGLNNADGSPWQVITPPARCENVFLGKRGDYKATRFTSDPRKSNLRADIVRDGANADFFDFEAI